MAKNIRRGLALVLTLLMCLGMMGTVAMAEDEATKEQPAGYDFISIYGGAYEMSGHMMTANGGEGYDIPQTLMIAPVGDESNYEALYCCDAETGYDNGIYYKRMNLEDSDYYGAAAAAHIRAIMDIAYVYPHRSLESMKAILAEKGFEDAAKLTRGEIISAVQAAIWYYANNEAFVYGRTFNVGDNSQWGTVVNDYGTEGYEDASWWPTGKRKYATNEEVGARINSLIEFLKELDPIYPEKDEMIITELEILDSIPVQGNDGTYSVALRVQLNGTGKESDDLTLKIMIDGEVVATKDVDGESDTYEMVVEAQNGQKIEAEISGTQVLAGGVFFYEPEGGRSISQCLVGPASGATAIYAAKDVTLDVDPVYGRLELLKVDNNGKPLSGATFKLFVKSENGDIAIGKYEVGEDGRLVIENLLPGNYCVKETKAPFGYVGAEGKIGFTIDEEGNLIGETVEEGVLVVENDPFEVEFNPGEVSNITYMLIDKDGNVEFVDRIESVDGGSDSAPIIVKEGYISAIFMKQATTGLLWFSHEVGDDVIDATVECLRANNPSNYDDFDPDRDIAFGFGEHDLKVKKKTVTYNFFGETFEVTIPTDDEPVEEEPVEEEPGEEEPVEEEPVEEEPVEEEPVEEEPGEEEPGEEEDDTIVVEPVEPPVVVEPEKVQWNVTFKKGTASHICRMFIDKETGEVEFRKKTDFSDDQTSAKFSVQDGFITAIYMKQAKSGMIWTSEAINEDLLADVVACLEENDGGYKDYDAVADGEGNHDLTYAQNKKKNKTVTYKFFEVEE